MCGAFVVIGPRTKIARLTVRKNKRIILGLLWLLARPCIRPRHLSNVHQDQIQHKTIAHTIDSGGTILALFKRLFFGALLPVGHTTAFAQSLLVIIISDGKL